MFSLFYLPLYLNGLEEQTANLNVGSSSLPRGTHLTLGELAEWLIAVVLRTIAGTSTTGQEFESPAPRSVY